MSVWAPMSGTARDLQRASARDESVTEARAYGKHYGHCERANGVRLAFVSPAGPLASRGAQICPLCWPFTAWS